MGRKVGRQESIFPNCPIFTNHFQHFNYFSACSTFLNKNCLWPAGSSPDPPLRGHGRGPPGGTPMGHRGNDRDLWEHCKKCGQNIEEQIENANQLKHSHKNGL